MSMTLYALKTLRNFVFVLLLLPLVAFAKDKERVEQIAQILTEQSEDCVILAHLYQPNNIEGNHLGLCVYLHKELKGIFMASACVVVTIEPETKTRIPAYGKDGHWGLEESCDKKRFHAKLKEKQTLETKNPITDLRDLRTQGWVVEKLKDEYDAFDTIMKLSTPLPEKEKPKAEKEKKKK